MKLLHLELFDNEKVLMKIRQHWVLLIWPVWKFLFLAVLGAAVAVYFDGFKNIMGVLLYIAWVLLVFNPFFHSWLKWYLNYYIVTNHRIINITHDGIFKRQTSEASLHKVQDVTYRTLGFVSMLFNFGDVIIQTAGHRTLIHFRMVSKPMDVHRQINQLLASHRVQTGPSFMREQHDNT